MKKMMKKLIAMAAALVMIVTLLPAVGVNAEQTITQNSGSVTVNKRVKGGNDTDYVENAVFSFYKVASLEAGANGTYRKWELTNDFNSLGLTSDDLVGISTKDLEEKISEAVDLTDYVKEGGVSATTTVITNNTGTAKAENLELGYYLVIETSTPDGYVASKPFFVAVPMTVTTTKDNVTTSIWNYNIEVEPKNEKIPDVTKDSDVETAGVGDPVTYTITGSTVPSYDLTAYDENSLEYIITDELSRGLTYNAQNANFSIVAKASGISDVALSSSEYTLTPPSVDNNNTMIISLTPDAIVKYAGKSIVVTYTVTVNEHAIVGIGEDENGILNKVKLEYTNNPDGSTDGSETKKKVYSFKINVNKTDEKELPLAGAKFGLYTDAACTDGNKVAEGTSTSEGIVDFGKSIKAGEYYLKELVAPEKYTLLTSPIKVVISDADANKYDYDFNYIVNNDTSQKVADNGIIIVNVENQKGFTLPETGGMGTYLFTIGGIVIMAGAAFALIAMKKRA